MTVLVLRALTGELRGQEFAVTGSAHWVLGRSRSCSLRLRDDSTVSRQHCLIEMDGSGAWVQDLGSLNGTHVNGQRINPLTPETPDATVLQSPRQFLNDGDELRICNNVFAVCLTEVEAPSVKEAKIKIGSSHEFHFSQGA